MFYGHWTEMGLIYFYLAMLSCLSHHFCLFRGFLVYLLSIPKSSPALDNFIFFYKYRISGENLKLLFRYVQMYVFFLCCTQFPICWRVHEFLFMAISMYFPATLLYFPWSSHISWSSQVFGNFAAARRLSVNDCMNIYLQSDCIEAVV